MSFHHPVLSPSPVEKAFCYVVSNSTSTSMPSSTSSASSSQHRYQNSYCGGGGGGGVVGNSFSKCYNYYDNDEDNNKNSNNNTNDNENNNYNNINDDNNINNNDDNHSIDVNDDSDFMDFDLPPFYLSPPEFSLLKSAEENPIEYTLAELDDAISYIRILLKMLDQVTTAPTTSSSSGTATTSGGILSSIDSGELLSSNDEGSINMTMTLETPPLTDDEAFAIYYCSGYQYKKLTVAHYCVTKIYEIICVSLDYERINSNSSNNSNNNNNNTQKSSSHNNRNTQKSNSNRFGGMDRGSRRGHGRGIPSLPDLFYFETELDSEDEDENKISSSNNYHSFGTATTKTKTQSRSRSSIIKLDDEEWRPLLRILYNRCVDEYTKRGSALILAYILKVGCEKEKEEKLRRKSFSFMMQKKKKKKQPVEEGILLLPLTNEEHKTTNLPSSIHYYPHPTLVDTGNKSNNNNKRIIEETLQSLISWLTSRLQTSTGNYESQSLCVITPTLNVLMSTTRQARIAFNESGGIDYLARHMKEKRRKQRSIIDVRRNSNSSSSRLSITVRTDLRRSNSAVPQRQPHQPVSVSPTASMVGMVSSSSVSSPARNRTSTTLIRRNSRSSFTSNLGDALTSSLNSFGVGGGGTKNNDSKTTNFSSSVLPGSPVSSSSAAVVVAEISDFLTTTVTAAATTTNALLSQSLSSVSVSPRSSIQQQQQKSSCSMTSSQSQQLLYDLVFSMWCMSLDCTDDESIRRNFVRRDGAIPALAYLLKTAQREKVIRMAIACLLSLATTTATNDDDEDDDSIFIRRMVGCGIIKVLNQMIQLRSCNYNIDLQNNVNFLYKLLNDYMTSKLTRLWDVYMLQIENGILRWDDDYYNSIHTTNFFRSNSIYMEGTNYDFYPLKCLINILYNNRYPRKSSDGCNRRSYIGLKEIIGNTSSSSSSLWDKDNIRDDELCESITVCLYDIGEFVQHYPGGNGRSIIKKLDMGYDGNGNSCNAKQLIMQYLLHPRIEVQQQAVLCASKLLVKSNKY